MINPFSLEDKNIVITGASSGIGRQCAINCSQMGANVILIARNEERLKGVYNHLDKGNHLYFSQDITKYNEIEPIISKTVSKLGQIHGFVHSAGIEMTLPLRAMKPEYYEQLFALNSISGFEIARVLSKKKYLHNNGASFVFISSIMSVVSNSALTAYSASKGAVTSAVKAMALELVQKKIRVNSISPAHIKNTIMSEQKAMSLSEKEMNLIINMHPMGLGKPEDIANACIYLLSDASGWVTGTNFIIDGGYSAR